MPIAALASALLLLTAAPDLTLRQQDQGTRVPDVTVTGRPTEEAVRNFVRQVAAPPRGRGLARWRQPVCAGTVNLEREAAQQILDRIAGAALDLDLDVGEPGCDPNLVVIFTTDAPTLAQSMVAADRSLFDAGVGGIERGAAPLRDFQTSDRPVRWWQMSIPVNAVTGERAIRMPGEAHSGPLPPHIAKAIECSNWEDCPLAAPIIQSTTGSRLVTAIEDALYKTIIIVDVDQVADASAASLGDYLAFVGLAQIDPLADTNGYDTVLNLFDDPGADGLSEWDRSYLQALYSSRPGNRSASAQAGVISGIMIHDRTSARE
ncbi:MAG: hypothetical protein B7Y86_14120 [Brevundimonas subvibrioides]|uniref:Uncharacterized protein n=1 Tax=Brevundimonas subvibrioides TaxID=74313 RepID=A0A258HF19_9CAUL|nr:hypothetical protein [Brevundimonas subvibrioides]OYX55217.1 MAG: hypothetical protein B7Y86_14120 [Brevundimonas subvibrioides]